jgi:hypothetical protein
MLVTRIIASVARNVLFGARAGSSNVTGQHAADRTAGDAPHRRKTRPPKQLGTEREPDDGVAEEPSGRANVDPRERDGRRDQTRED